LQFVIEKEKNNELPFLDMITKRNSDGSIIIDWYRKPHKADRYLNFHSHHPLKQKINTAMALKFRALSLSDKIFHKKNLKIIGDILEKNHFPKKLISNILYSNKKSSSQTHNTITTTNISNTNTDQYRGMIYINGLSEQITKVFKKTNFKIAHKNYKTQHKLIYSKLKSNTPMQLRSNIIYSIPCKDCDKNYIGQTCQYLKNRISQHKTSIKTKNQICALADHAITNSHSFRFEEAKILDTEPVLSKRLFKEMYHISRNKKSCNKRTDITYLSKIYHNLINDITNKERNPSNQIVNK
jgi:hypothetical protein